MKRLLKIIFVLCIAGVLLSASCKKEKTGIDALPPITQSGEQTIGCLINGEVFVPNGATIDGGPIKQSNYQWVDGHQYFLLSASAKNRKKNEDYQLIIRVLDINLKTGMTIQLVDGNSGEGNGEYYYYYGPGYFIKYNTTKLSKGELKITRFDESKQIVSGTFWFNATDKNGEKIEVREGRFDMYYTK